MSEREIDARRNWKAQTFPYDYYTIEPGKECQYCLTEKQAELLRGLLDPVGWKTRWWSDVDAPIDSDVILEFRDDLIRRLMMSCCGDETPIQYRYTSDGVLQKSEDGGETWVDAPQDDVRNNSPQFPPMSGEDGDDKKCIAATGAAVLLKEQVGDNLTDDMTRAALLAILTGWVTTFIQTSNPYEALKTVINNVIFALEIVLLRPALTDDTYDQFKCILYCHMNDDASVSEDELNLIQFDILTQITGIAGSFYSQIVFLLGAGGLTNLLRAAGSSTGDCEDCDCNDGCDTVWQVYDPGAGHFGEILEQTGDFIIAQTTGINTNNVYYIYLITDDVNNCCYINSMEVLEGDIPASPFAGSNCGNAIGTGIGNYTGGCFNQLQPQNPTPFKVKYNIAPCP